MWIEAVRVESDRMWGKGQANTWCLRARDPPPPLEIRSKEDEQGRRPPVFGGCWADPIEALRTEGRFHGEAPGTLHSSMIEPKVPREHSRAADGGGADEKGKGRSGLVAGGPPAARSRGRHWDGGVCWVWLCGVEI